MKCCFCGAELEKSFENTELYSCSNYECPHVSECMEIGVWQSLISGKKAQDALKELKSYYDVCKKGHEKGEDIDWCALIETTVDKITQ